jgi:hypothetical protein
MMPSVSEIHSVDDGIINESGGVGGLKTGR